MSNTSSVPFKKYIQHQKCPLPTTCEISAACRTPVTTLSSTAHRSLSLKGYKLCSQYTTMEEAMKVIRKFTITCNEL